MTYPSAGDSSPKGGIIPGMILGFGCLGMKASSQGPPLEEGFTAYQLVGGVMAHQGYDG